MSSENYTIVCVLRAYSHHSGAEHNNFQRFLEIGMPTYQKFFTPEAKSTLHTFYVIVPKDEVAVVEGRLQAAFPDWPWKVINEDTLLHSNIPAGWGRQQTAKLAVAYLVQTDLYLLVDDDTYLTKPFRGLHDLREEGTGKVIMNKTPIDFPFFFLWSCQLLEYDFDKVQDAPYHMHITPEVFITHEVQGLVKHLTRRYGDKKVWQLKLVQHKFTEFCLYWIWLIMQNKTHLYVNEQSNCRLYAYETSAPEHDLGERVKLSFTDNRNHLFSFVQSSLPHSVSAVRKLVREHIN